MQPAPIPGFITKKETAQQFQRSHRQITRDLAEAMKVQNAKVLDHCRLRTEDGQTREGIGVTPELLDELRLSGQNPVWYLRVSWLEKSYGRRGRPPRRDQIPSDPPTNETGEGSDGWSRPELVHVLRERIRALEQDKQDLRDEMKIKNTQIGERVEREKETNALIRDLHTLMADLQRRLLPPPAQAPALQITEPSATAPTPSAEQIVLVKPKSTARATAREKGSRKPSKQSVRKSRQKHVPKKPAATTKHPPKADARPEPKPKSLWSRLFPR